MEIKSYTNAHKFEVVDCPFCTRNFYVRTATKAAPDALRDLKRHITNEAKKEALDYYLLGEPILHPHLEYYKQHTAPRVEPVKTKRQYDEDIQLTK